MKKVSNAERPDSAPEHPLSGLTDAQRQVLAKVYRFLLRLRNAQTNGRAGESHSLPDTPSTDETSRPQAKAPDE